MKKFNKIAAVLLVPVLLILLLSAFAPTPRGFTPRLTAPARNSYHFFTGNIYAQHGWPMPNCAAYAWGRLYEITGVRPRVRPGNANVWFGSGGYLTGNKPALGAVMAWNSGPMGHVAIVEKIHNNGTVTISESHSSGTFFNTRVVPADGSHLRGFQGFIYVIDRDTPLIPRTPPRNGSNVFYTTNIRNLGWQNPQRNGGTSGTTGRSLQMEALRIEMDTSFSGNVEYRAHVANIGWQGWRRNGEIAGTLAQSRRMEAVEIRLTGELARNHDIWYRVHVQNIGWLGWARNGASAGSTGMGLQAEAIEIRLTARGGAAPGSTATPLRTRTTANPATATGTSTPVTGMAINYNSHLLGIGWQGTRSNGALSGTTGQSRRMEGIQVRLANTPVTGGVRYRTHVSNIGWQNWQNNGGTAGVPNGGLRVEAVQIELTGNMASRFRVEYRAHVANIGWLGWVRDGAIAGTTGQSRQMEAIEVRLVPR